MFATSPGCSPTEACLPLGVLCGDEAEVRLEEFGDHLFDPVRRHQRALDRRPAALA